LVERFPDGAWVFYRLTSAGLEREMAGEILSRTSPDDPILARDRRKLYDVQAERAAAAQDYFAENAAQWDEIRSLYGSDHAGESEILQATGEGRFRRLVDLGA